MAGPLMLAAAWEPANGEWRAFVPAEVVVAFVMKPDQPGGVLSVALNKDGAVVGFDYCPQASLGVSGAARFVIPPR